MYDTLIMQNMSPAGSVTLLVLFSGVVMGGVQFWFSMWLGVVFSVDRPDGQRCGGLGVCQCC